MNNDFMFDSSLPYYMWTDLPEKEMLHFKIIDIANPRDSPHDKKHYNNYTVEVLKEFLSNSKAIIYQHEIIELDIPINSFKYAWKKRRVEALSRTDKKDMILKLQKLNRQTIKFYEYEFKQR